MNKIALVTGASRGIGAATAVKLASKGYKVCINYIRNSKAAASVCDSINELGGTAISFKADVSKEEEVRRLFCYIQTELGEVTHLVNNVGILFTKTDFTHISAERFREVLNANVISAFLCSVEFVKRGDSQCAIVNVSSAAARTGAPFEYVDYAASKGALDALTKGLSVELASKNIRVNAVRPGFINTDIHADGGEPDRVERLSSQIPLGRGGSTNEVANTIAWLLSEEASYVTGSFIDVAGGK